MADLSTRDEKLVQYLNEAHGKEKELETALEAHIGMTTRRPYKKRLQQHLKETKNHARLLERRIKKLGGEGGGLGGVAGEVAGRALATAKGPLHAVRGTGEEERQLKNARSEYADEAEEIATYSAIEALAEAVGDTDTAKLARQIRREEERMANFLAKQIPVLTRAVAQAEVPARERKQSGRGRSRSRRGDQSRSRRGDQSRSRRGGQSRSRRSGQSRAGKRRGSRQAS